MGETSLFALEFQFRQIARLDQIRVGMVGFLTELLHTYPRTSNTSY